MEQHQPQFLYLTTEGWKTGRQHKIEIWFVSYADRYYILSEPKEKAHWVQNIMHQPKVRFTVNSKSFEGTPRPVGKLAEHKLTKHISNKWGLSTNQADYSGIIITVLYQLHIWS